MDINNFRFICEIEPITDEYGQIIEYSPSSEYKNKENKKLNKYGKGPFCKFTIPSNLNCSGVYIIKVNDDIKYVGECDNLSKRFNMGYGQISPRNCFEGGQSTNCKINSFILKEVKAGSKVFLFFYETHDRFQIERELIKKYNPEWNSTFGKNIRSDVNEFVNIDYKGMKSVGKKSKYYPLQEYLERLSYNIINLTFEEIEKIIGNKLPDSAYKHTGWWANGGHSHASTWLNAGWKVDKVELGNFVVFVKNMDKKVG